MVRCVVNPRGALSFHVFELALSGAMIQIRFESAPLFFCREATALNPRGKKRKQEMSKKEAIKNAVSAATAHGFTIPDSIRKMVDDIENPVYRVAVVGQYQVGKSTLINKAYLGDKPLLTEGRGCCTTAVATDMEYGPSPKLEVYDWTDNRRDTDTCVKTIDNPSAEDVNAATVSSDMSTRSQLARKRSRVRVSVPNEAIRGYTIIDTPGLDDPEEELLANTTFRIIPGADVALLVVKAKALDDVEKRILRNEIIGKNGISRLMVLVSYNAKTQDLDDEGRESIVKTIKADLANIGREDIEVFMYCFDPSIEDITSDVSEIRTTIRTFLNANRLPGREEKLAGLMRAELEKIQVEVAAQLKLAGASETEINATNARLEAEVNRFKEKCERSFEGLKFDIGGIRDQMYNDVDLAVQGVFDRFYLQMETADDVSKMNAIAAKAETLIKLDLQSQISIIGLNLKEKIKEAVARYSDQVNDIHASWNLYLKDEFGVDRPFVTKIPSFVYDGINVVLMNIILPGGWLVAIVGHLIGKGIFDPTKWVAEKLVLNRMKAALDESQGEVRQQIMDQISDNLKLSFDGIKTSIEESNRAQVAAIRAGIKSAADSGSKFNRAELESAKADIEAALAQL